MTDGLTGRHATLLQKVDLFAGLDRMALAQVAAFVEAVTVQEGEVVFHQASPATPSTSWRRGHPESGRVRDRPRPAGPGPAGAARAARARTRDGVLAAVRAERRGSPGRRRHLARSALPLCPLRAAPGLHRRAGTDPA